MSASPLCSVIVPSYQSQDTIRACLASLTAQRNAPPFEIILADSSTDATRMIAAAEFPQVRVLGLPERCDPAEARNHGARLGRGRALAFLDSDCTAPPGWLGRLYDLLQNGNQAAGGSIANANRESLVSWAGYICEFREFLPDGPPRPVANLTLGNAAYLAGPFWEAGGFPAGCFPQEDQVFHRAFRGAGFRIWFDPSIVVHHRHRESLQDFLEHQRSIGYANARVAARLGLPGASLVKRHRLARLALPGVAVLRLARTLWACRRVEKGLAWRRPELVWLCGRGMAWWSRGFLKAAGGAAPVREGQHAEAGR